MNPKAGLFMLLSSAAFAIMYLLAKQLDSYGGFTLTFFRGLGTFVIAAGYLLVQKISLGGSNPKLLIARALSGSLSLLLFFLAVKHVPITAAVSIRYLSPLFAIVLAMIFLRERVKPIQWVFFLIAFLGVVLLKGVDPRLNGVGLTLILASAVLGGVTFAIIRAIGGSEHPLVIVSYFTGAATLLGFGGLILGFEAYQQPVGADWFGLLGLGVVGFIGQLFMTVAIQTESASKVMPLKYLEAVILLVLSYFFLEETYSFYALIGMVLIILGNLLNVFGVKKE